MLVKWNVYGNQPKHSNILREEPRQKVGSLAFLFVLLALGTLLVSCSGQPNNEADSEDVPSELPIPSVPEITSHESPYITNDPQLNLSGNCESGQRIQISGGGFSFETQCQGSAYSFSMTAPSDGSYLFEVIAVNEFSQTATTSLEWILDRQAPDAPNITSPGQPHSTGLNQVSLSGDCEEGTEVFMRDLDSLAVVSQNCSSGGFNFTSEVKSSDGDYDFEVYQVDLAGNQSANSDFRWTRESVVYLPVSSILMPVNGTYGIDGVIEFTLSWDEAMDVSGVPRLPLDVGGSTRYANYVSGTGSQHLAFQYVVQAGDADLDGISTGGTLELNGGSIEGAVSSNPALLDVSAELGSLASVMVDTSSPPPDKVMNLVSAPSTNNTALNLSWAIPADNGQAITHYVVQYREQGQSLWSNLSPNPSLNSATLTGLTANVTYEIRVAASNGALGPYSDIDTEEIFDIMGFSPIAWLDSTDILGDGSVPTDGSLVSTWVDKTASAQSATEADPAKQPVYQHDVQNGLPAVRFVDLDRGLQGTFTRNNGTDLTIIIVGQYDNGLTDKCMFEFIGPGGARAFFIDRRYAANTFYSPALTKGSFNIWRIENSGAFATVTENTNTQIYNNATHFNTDFTGTGNYYLGDDSTGNNRMTGFIGEILIFDSALSPADITKIESYLKNKWGL